MMSQPATPPPPQETQKPAVARAAAPPKPTHVAQSSTATTTPAPASEAPGMAAAATTSPPAAPSALPGQTMAAIPPGQAPAPNPATMNPPAPAVTPPAQTPLPKGQVYGSLNTSARVVLRVHQATRVLVQGGDGKVFINRTLQPGDTYQVPNVVGLTLTTTNASSVEIDLDGAAMGFAGKQAGMAEAISLDPQAIVDRSAGG
jgi:hypothetical protein